MTTNFKARLLQHLITKKEDGGFTLIELLVVIIIIGILAAIALPSFLNQANRARETEASNFVGSINRGQQAYRLEFPKFANEFQYLEVSVGQEVATDPAQRKGEFYTYTIAGATDQYVDLTAESTDTNLHGFRGCVNAVDGQSSAEITKNTDTNGNAPADCKTINP